jgi:hypothetical protein
MAINHSIGVRLKGLRLCVEYRGNCLDVAQRGYPKYLKRHLPLTCSLNVIVNTGRLGDYDVGDATGFTNISMNTSMWTGWYDSGLCFV